MKFNIYILIISFSLFSSYALGAGGSNKKVEDIDFSFEGPLGTYDRNQLQRGLQVFTEVCSGCHGLSLVAFRNLSDKGGPELSTDQMKAYAKEFEVYDSDIDDFRSAKPSDKFPYSAVENAPDLSLMAKARAGFHGPYGTGVNQLFKGMGGPEYIVNLLLAFNEEEKEQAGSILYGNDIYPGGWINMGQPLWGDDVEYIDGTEATIEQEAKDVASFLMWAAEPKLNARKEFGLTTVLILLTLSVLLYFTNKKLWKPHKNKTT